MLRTADGVELASTWLSPGAPRGVAVVAPAMGVTARFYSRFAGWLQEQGYAVLTFDYRGIGQSLQGSLRDVEVDVVGWARYDAGAALDQAASTGLPILWIGHSLGGQILPFIPGIERVGRVVTVATGSGYWRENAPRLRMAVWWLWYVAVPISMRMYGYFPGRRLRKVGDLPRGVMAQWRQWCLDPEYAAGTFGSLYAEVKLPITSLSFTDDEFMSERNIRSLHSHYTGSQVELRRYSPAEVGRVGHFGFFKRPDLYRLVLE